MHKVVAKRGKRRSEMPACKYFLANYTTPSPHSIPRYKWTSSTDERFSVVGFEEEKILFLRLIINYNTEPFVNYPLPITRTQQFQLSPCFIMSFCLLTQLIGEIDFVSVTIPESFCTAVLLWKECHKSWVIRVHCFLSGNKRLLAPVSIHSPPSELSWTLAVFSGKGCGPADNTTLKILQAYFFRLPLQKATARQHNRASKYLFGCILFSSSSSYKNILGMLPFLLNCTFLS